MGQKDGEKWTAAADLQPTISKSDRLLGREAPNSAVARQVRSYNDTDGLEMESEHQRQAGFQVLRRQTAQARARKPL